MVVDLRESAPEYHRALVNLATRCVEVFHEASNFHGETERLEDHLNTLLPSIVDPITHAGRSFPGLPEPPTIHDLRPMWDALKTVGDMETGWIGGVAAAIEKRNAGEARKEVASQHSEVFHNILSGIRSMALRRHGLGPATDRNGLRDSKPSYPWADTPVASYIRRRDIAESSRLLILGQLLRLRDNGRRLHTNQVKRKLESMRERMDKQVKDRMQRSVEFSSFEAGKASFEAGKASFEHVLDVEDVDAMIQEVVDTQQTYLGAMRSSLSSLEGRRSWEVDTFVDGVGSDLAMVVEQMRKERARIDGLAGVERTEAIRIVKRVAAEASRVRWETDSEEVRRRIEAQKQESELETALVRILRGRLQEISTPQRMDVEETMPHVGTTFLHRDQAVVVTAVTQDPDGSFVEVRKADGSFVHTTEEHLLPLDFAAAVQSQPGLPSVEQAEEALRLRLCSLISVHTSK